MATLASVLTELKSKASERTRATYIRHGSPAQHTLGVSVADMKVIAKAIRKQQALACELYDTGIFDAMYLAGMVADGAQLTKSQLHRWADAAANMPMVSEYTVPWVALESDDPRGVATKWIQSQKEHMAAAGWRTYAGIVETTPDNKLNLTEIETLLETIPPNLDAALNRVRYTMNGFVIAVGSYVAPLFKKAEAVAQEIGAVDVNVGDTACKVPLATSVLAKASGRPVVKRKTIRC